MYLSCVLSVASQQSWSGLRLNYYSMETKEYFEKVMQDFNQHRNGRSLRKYCQDEGIDYKWLQEYKRTYPNETKPVQESKPEPQSFIPLVIEEEKTQPKPVRQVSHLRLESPDGGFIDINSNNLAAVTSLLQSLSSPC